MVYISLELTRVNPDRNIFSINVKLTSTFLHCRGLVHHHHRILNDKLLKAKIQGKDLNEPLDLHNLRVVCRLLSSFRKTNKKHLCNFLKGTIVNHVRNSFKRGLLEISWTDPLEQLIKLYQFIKSMIMAYLQPWYLSIKQIFLLKKIYFSLVYNKVHTSYSALCSWLLYKSWEG